MKMFFFWKEMIPQFFDQFIFRWNEVFFSFLHLKERTKKTFFLQLWRRRGNTGIKFANIFHSSVLSKKVATNVFCVCCLFCLKMHFKAERSIVAKMTSPVQENQFVMQAINNWSNEIGKKERKKERSGDTVAEWSMALLLREKINANQKILGSPRGQGNLKN